jgi:hypothetical protein
MVRVMVFNATFNNISAISWRSVLLVDETNVPEQNHRPVESEETNKKHIPLFYNVNHLISVRYIWTSIFICPI